MQNSTRKWQVMFFGIAVIIALVIYLICLPGRSGVTSQNVTQAAPFGTSNYNLMKTDTFVALLHRAYGNLIKDTMADNKLTVEMKGSEMSRDFFNSNDALLKFSLTDFGFDIKYNQQDKSVKAVFSIQAGNGVNVPNDVIIKLMDKNTGVSHVDQQK
jgi:hypothetical protein